MARFLKGRLEKLEAKRRHDANRVVGVIGGAYGQLVPNPDKPGHLMFSQPPEGFAAFAANQQSNLQAMLRDLAEEEPAPKRTAGNVGNPSGLAPLKPGTKRRRYFEINGREVDALALRGNEK